MKSILNVLCSCGRRQTRDDDSIISETRLPCVDKRRSPSFSIATVKKSPSARFTLSTLQKEEPQVSSEGSMSETHPFLEKPISNLGETTSLKEEKRQTISSARSISSENLASFTSQNRSAKPLSSLTISTIVDKDISARFLPFTLQDELLIDLEKQINKLDDLNKLLEESTSSKKEKRPKLSSMRSISSENLPSLTLQSRDTKQPLSLSIAAIIDKDVPVRLSPFMPRKKLQTFPKEERLFDEMHFFLEEQINKLDEPI